MPFLIRRTYLFSVSSALGKIIPYCPTRASVSSFLNVHIYSADFNIFEFLSALKPQPYIFTLIIWSLANTALILQPGVQGSGSRSHPRGEQNFKLSIRKYGYVSK